MTNNPDGILLIDKEAGETSYTTIKRVGRILKVKKIGHAGTLDPAATGLLIVLLGQGTKLSPYLMTRDKEYWAVMRLGIVTDTLDADGQVLQAVRVPFVDAARLKQCAAEFTGEIEQVPPAYSALKYQGKPAYVYARRGLKIELAKRTVTIRRLEIQAVDPPDVTLQVACSSGTYIRTLAADLGNRMGPGAHLKELRRLSIGRFALAEAASLAEGDADFLEQHLRSRIIPLKEAVKHLAEWEVDEATAKKIRNGRRIDLKELSPSQYGQELTSGEIKLVCGDALVAIARLEFSGSQNEKELTILRVFQ
ncbi:MAG: tRNA pseudouridine(55) synthase TruB [Desulfobacteraceae bacterium]|nr:MAG: tRNA pseudouridine(55) synthase TruB [Desulfobacteraceae bacterium]